MMNTYESCRRIVRTTLAVVIILSSFESIGQSTLVAFYPFNNGAGDVHIHHYDGAVNGAILTTDRFGTANSAYYFDGSGSYISLPMNNLELSDYSYSLWVKPSEIGSLPITPISFGGNQADQFVLVNSGSGWTAGSYNTSGTDRIVSSLIGVDTNWHHIVSTRENNAIRLYVDGVLVNSNTSISASGAGYQGTTLRALIGGRCDLAQYFSGKIDDVKIYDGVLTASEVLTLYNTATGVADKYSISFSVSPNPSTGTFAIQLDNGSEEDIVVVRNIHGQIVYKEKSHNGSILIHCLEKGLYFCTVESNGVASQATKLVVN